MVASEIFQISLLTYLILALLESLKPGFISYFFNLNILLGVVLVCGIVSVLPLPATSKKELHKHLLVESFENWIHEDRKKMNGTLTFLMSLGGGAIVYYKTQDLGGVALAIAIVAGLIIALLSFLVYAEEN